MLFGQLVVCVRIGRGHIDENTRQDVRKEGRRREQTYRIATTEADRCCRASSGIQGIFVIYVGNANTSRWRAVRWTTSSSCHDEKPRKRVEGEFAFVHHGRSLMRTKDRERSEGTKDSV